MDKQKTIDFLSILLWEAYKNLNQRPHTDEKFVTWQQELFKTAAEAAEIRKKQWLTENAEPAGENSQGEPVNAAEKGEGEPPSPCPEAESDSK